MKFIYENESSLQELTLLPVSMGLVVRLTF